MGKWIVSLALTLAACSSSGGDGGKSANVGGSDAGGAGSAGASASNTGGSAPGSGNANGGGASGSAGTNSAGGGGLTGGSGASNTFTSVLVDEPARMRGLVFLNQFTADKTTFRFEASASFGNERGAWDGCTKNQLGDCWYYDCPAGSNSVGNTMPPSVRENANRVSLSGMTQVELPFNGTAGTYDANSELQLWPLSGGSVTLDVMGSSSVPAVSMQVPVPSHVFLTSLNGEADPTTLQRSDGVKIVWQAEGTSPVFFAIFALTGERPAAVCTFDGTTTSAELPASVLEHLDPGSYYYQLRGDLRARMPDGPWDIETESYAFGGDPSVITRMLTLE